MNAWKGDTLTTYTGKAVTAVDLGAIVDLEYFDNLDEPVLLTRRQWAITAVDHIVVHPSNELCGGCHGEGEYNPEPSLTIKCPFCGGDGTHRLAGQVEVLG